MERAVQRAVQRTKILRLRGGEYSKKHARSMPIQTAQTVRAVMRTAKMTKTRPRN